jgi:DNA-binding transcriptional LysR family regulator
MDRLGDLEAFVAIVEGGGQTEAARRLRRSLQSINRSLVALERGMGVELVRRTTRRSRPSEAGLAFYHRIKPALAEIGTAKLAAADQRGEPSGLLRISAPTLFASAHVAPVISEFLRRYPDTAIELRASDRPVDVVEEGLDVAIRIRDLPDSSLKARRLGALRIVVFGAPEYFEEHSRPQHPDELAQHQCVLRLSEASESWPFRMSSGRKSVHVHGRFKTDSAAAGQVAVVHGLGLGRAPLWQIRALIDTAAVEIVLEDFEVEKLPIYAVMSPAGSSLAKTRLFVSLLATRLKHEDGRIAPDH